MRIAALMRAARKKNDLTQVEVAKRLQISQSALSKIESGLLIPSAPQWFEFCQVTHISPDSLTTGYMERLSTAVIESGDLSVGFKIPKAYRPYRGSKMRAMLPFLQYFRAVAGEEKVEQYFRSIKMDPDSFIDLDGQINLRFCLDLSRTLIQSGFLKPDDFSRMTSSVSHSETHGRLHRMYDGQTDPLVLTQVLLQNSRQYECNFQYQIEERNPKHLVFSVKPEEHLSEFQYRQDPVLGDFLCRFKKHYFESFTHYGNSHGATLHERQCHYQGADSCVYELKTG
jgi:transcriptional regulator with XRE-family HTH domain